MSLSSSSTASPSQTLSELLRSGGITPASIVRVTGPGALSALIWLCRHGYEKVGCLKAGQRSPADDAEALLVARTCTPAVLEALLAAGPHVCCGGVMIVQAEPAAPVEGVFHRYGFRVERRLRGRHREVLVARRMAAGLRRAA